MNSKLIDQKIVRELSKSNNYIAFRDLFARVSGEILLIFTLIFCFNNEEWLAGIIVIYALSIWHSFLGYAGLGHEFLHGRVFSNSIVNKILFNICSFLTWNNPSFFRKSHLYHHSYTFDENDFESFGPSNWSFLCIFYYLIFDIPLFFRRIFYVLINSLGYKFENKLFTPINNDQKYSAISLLFFQIILQIFIYFIIHDFKYNIIWLVVPFTGQFLTRILSQAQHIGLRQYAALGTKYQSRSIRLPSLIEFLYSGMNYHCEHHLFPTIPYYNLHKISYHIEKKYNHELIDWQTFFTSKFWILVKQKSW